jgi:hypothetical protein
MSKLTGAAPDPESEAQRLVGQFLQHFALLEQALDAGIGKLLGLEGGKNEIVCSSIPFAKKLGVFFSSEGLLAAIPDAQRKNQLKETRSKIMALNQTRIMFAHNPFSANTDGGVSFRRVVADTKLQVSNVVLSSTDVLRLCEEAKRLVLQLGDLVSEMKPYLPSLDFSDPRNSGYIALLF